VTFDYTPRYLKLALEAAHMFVWDSKISDDRVIDGEVIWTSNGASLLGNPTSYLRTPFKEFIASVHPDDRESVVNAMQQAVNTQSGYYIEYRVIWPDQSQHWLAAKAEAFFNSEDNALHTLGIIWDITDLKTAALAALRQKELVEITLSSIGDGVISTDMQGRVQYLNYIAEQLTGWTNEEANNAPIEKVFAVADERDGDVVENPALKCLRLQQSIGVSSRSQLITRNGKRIPIEDSASPIRGSNGAIHGVVVVFHDVSHERKLNHELSWHASHDPLTGLVNRREFENQVAAALANAKHDGSQHALLYLDLDQFKIVNDTCGHAAGDVLLKVLATMLQTRMRDADILARLGGDELGILLLNCPAEQAFGIAETVRRAIKDFRFVWDSHTFEIGVSIGFVVIDSMSKSTSELLSAADQACYVAKEQGRNRVHIYRETDYMLAKRHGETLWVSRLNDALKNDCFTLYMQPIVHLREPRLQHMEILIRMENGDGSLVLPGAFIPAAERYDIISSIDRWVIASVFQALSKMKGRNEVPGNRDARADSPERIYSINLSGLSLNDDFLKDFIAEKFQQYGIAPETICFEITETAVISNMLKAQDFINDVKNLGCSFALDDFGSGLSSFAYLKSLQVDYLKIDGAFVRDVATDAINHAMVSAINEVGHVMGIKTIAEYVEDDEILKTIHNIGVDFAQGYAVGPLQPLLDGVASVRAYSAGRA
jgi:diguanylate cyclase (GGDEF)-like protein/PAS domain S-box-containing protein